MSSIKKACYKWILGKLVQMQDTIKKGYLYLATYQVVGEEMKGVKRILKNSATLLLLNIKSNDGKRRLAQHFLPHEAVLTMCHFLFIFTPYYELYYQLPVTSNRDF